MDDSHSTYLGQMSKAKELIMYSGASYRQTHSLFIIDSSLLDKHIQEKTINFLIVTRILIFEKFIVNTNKGSRNNKYK